MKLTAIVWSVSGFVALRAGARGMRWLRAQPACEFTRTVIETVTEGLHQSRLATKSAQVSALQKNVGRMWLFQN